MFQALLAKAKETLGERFKDTVKSVNFRYSVERGRAEIVLQVYDLAFAEERKDVLAAHYGKFGLAVVLEQAEEKS